MKNLFFTTLAIIAFVLFGGNLFSQGVAINSDGTTADPSAMLDVKSTNAGILVPRLTQANIASISNPATGLLVFQTDGISGFYYNAGTPAVPSWIKLSIPTDNFDDADADATNELQTISISGHDITLSDGGGTVTVPDNNTTYSAGNQLSLSGTTFNVTEGSSSGLDADLLDGQHYSDIQSWVNSNDDNTTYSAGTGLTLTGTVFTPTFGTTAGTVSEGNHSHATLTRGTGLTGNNYNGSTATTWAVDFGNTTAAGNGTKAQGNFGQFQPHATYTDFNTNPAYWGWNYVQGTTNAPNATSSQWYRQVISLGSEYPARGAGGYSLEMAFPRYNTATAGVWVRTVENGTIGSWTRIDGSANVSGTTNYIAKFTSANVVGNSQIFDNGTNVGIGTATPSAGLHMFQDRYTLYGPNSNWGAYLQVGGNGRVTTYASVAATNGNLHLDAANGAYATYINYYSQNNTYINGQGGNVGIGNTGPAYKLDVTGDIRSTNKIWANANGASYFRGGDDAELWDVNVANTIGVYGVQNSAIATIRLGSGAADISGSAGNIGIGTTVPGQKLDIAGNSRTSGEFISTMSSGFGQFRAISGNYGVFLRNDGSNTYILATGSGDQYGSWNALRPFRMDNATGDLYFANTQVYVSHSTGNVGIGTTSPAQKLHVVGTTRVSTLSGTGNRNVVADANGDLIIGTATASDYVLSANFSSSTDDFSAFTDGTITGDDTETTVTMPFSVTFDGVSYSDIVISANGWVTFGTGANGSYSNSALPSSSFAGPTVFAYWDDLTTEGNNIRYGDVGSSPNRTFVIDYECTTLSGSYDVRFQVQIHEGSGLINVKYRDTMNAAANGQSATIGFQTAGAASAKAYPITYNGKVLDDNRDDSEGWSVCPVR